MRPGWFPNENIPYDEMWETDHNWIPLIIANKPFVARTDVRMGEQDKSIPLKWYVGVESDDKKM
jgi:hypothetical protein